MISLSKLKKTLKVLAKHETKKLLPKIRTLIISVDNCFLEVTTELLNEALKHA